MRLSGPIIIIEDDIDDQEILLDVFQNMGLNREAIRVFDTCRAALHYLRNTNEAPFIIFCDINLPEMNGLEFRRAINDDEYLRRKSIPFVFLSTTAEASQVREAYDLTVQGFFVKRLTEEDITRSIRRILEYWTDCIHPNALR